MARSFQYTDKNSSFTKEQRQFYEDNGYILIRNNVNSELLDKVRQRFLDICNGNNTRPIPVIMKDPSLKTKDIQDWLYDDILFEYAVHKPVVDIVESIIGPNITAAHSMLINKPPNVDPNISLHPLHQDLHYFPFRPADRIVASWTAMERVDQSNGCLYVIPGSHKGQLYPHFYPKGTKNKLYHGVQGLDHLPKTYVVMEKGDTVFFHPILLHGSGPNFTKGFRKAISCHYADSNSYFIDVKGTSHENIATESEELIQRMGYDVDYKNLWKVKSRLIRGVPGSFQNFDSHL